MLKESFPPIVNADTEILIVGSMPGDRSLQMKEYYAHPQNRFWKMLATILQQEMPTTYTQKINLLIHNKIGLWDIAHTAFRKGSLDSAIQNEEPNPINQLLLTHPRIRTVVFNGKKARAIFDIFFTEKQDIKYYTMPSTSAANAAINFSNLCGKWETILTSGD